jgi:hypothetical protein
MRCAKWSALETAGGQGRAQHRPIQPLFDQNGTPSLFAEESDEKPIPYIVIIIDELADLMMLDSQQRGRVDHAPGADGARGGHSPGSGHAAAFGRRDYRD